MSKIMIPTEIWVELYSELASWHVENSIDDPEAQDQFNAASSDIEEILESFFVKGSWSERENI